MSFISAILGKVWPYLVVAFSVVAAWLSGARAGRIKREKQALQSRLDTIAKTRKAERNARGKQDEELIDDLSHRD